MSAKRAADQVWALVPAWTRYRDREGLLRGLVEALGVGLHEVRRDIERLLDDMFVETCDDRLVPLIGDLVGVQVDPAIPIARQRHQVKHALHLRRRRGTVEQLETLGWQITGFNTRVFEAPSARRTVHDPPLSIRVNRPRPVESGARPSSAPATAVNVSRRIPAGKLEIVMDVLRPVRRAQVELVAMGADVHAVDAVRDVGLRRADGSPIFRADDPAELVGRGRPIEVFLVGADFARLGALRPRFTSLPHGAPIYVPDHTIVIDPERGRVAGPTGPAAGIRAYRRYRLRFWEPLEGELVRGAPAYQGEGIFTFASDSRIEGLTDTHGLRLRLGFEGERRAPDPGRDERLLVVRELGHERAGRPVAPFVLLRPGQPAIPADGRTRLDGHHLDVAGLNRLFSIHDEWGWDRFRHVRLVDRFGREPPPDDVVEVEVERGRFRVGIAHEQAELRVRYHRRYDLTAIKRRGEQALRSALPLGQTAMFRFRDTAPGSTERSTS